MGRQEGRNTANKNRNIKDWMKKFGTKQGAVAELVDACAAHRNRCSSPRANQVKCAGSSPARPANN